MMRLGSSRRRRGSKASGNSKASDDETRASKNYTKSRGATELKATIRQVIKETPIGTLRPMSTNEMAKIAMDRGVSADEARKMPTQIRLGGPLHEEWKDAFTSGRFLQKNGRPPRERASSSSNSTGTKNASSNASEDDSISAHQMMLDAAYHSATGRLRSETPRSNDYERRRGSSGGDSLRSESRMSEEDEFDTLNLDDPSLLEDLMRYSGAEM